MRIQKNGTSLELQPVEGGVQLSMYECNQGAKHIVLDNAELKQLHEATRMHLFQNTRLAIGEG